MQFFQKVENPPPPVPQKKKVLSLTVKYVSEKEWKNLPKEIRVK